MKQLITFIKNKSHGLKASSLINAVFICVIISVFSGCLVLLSHYQNMLNNQLYMQENLINRNIASFNYLINNLESIDYNKVEKIDVFDDNLFSYLEKKNWGFYDIIVSKTIFKNDTISKTAMVGKVNVKADNLALYVTDYDKPLKLSGSTKILGDIKVPNGRTEQAYINGNKGNKIKLRGKASKSNDRLPKINKDIRIDFSDYEPIPFNSLDKETIVINGFDKTTKLIDLNEINTLSNIVLKGNIVLTSNNELQIEKTAKLNDVLVIAPKVKILSGFKGNIQVIAKKTVEVDEDVLLKYPSSIYVKNDNDSVSVVINKDSKILGGIVIDGDTHSGALKRILEIKETAIVVGSIYCYGKTQFEGRLIGSVFTDRFNLKTKSSNYENVILNASINRDSLPKNFIELPLFKNDIDNKKYAIVKEF
ncbi:hypothetical protein [Algibacter sp. 2305UL17-15]|uniref:hypothetical protein n=1 Tax=Algibacter sp. 2305UL17-15 TaxID=3231268 RepID=UPI0034592B0B